MRGAYSIWISFVWVSKLQDNTIEKNSQVYLQKQLFTLWRSYSSNSLVTLEEKPFKHLYKRILVKLQILQQFIFNIHVKNKKKFLKKFSNLKDNIKAVSMQLIFLSLNQ